MTSTSSAPHNNQTRVYDRETSVVFLKTKERFGGLSNMAAGFPLRVNGVCIKTSEALYQACRFPHMPEVQQLIIGENSPMTAKMRSKPHRRVSRHDWNFVRVKIMRWCLRVKLAQNWREFGRLLLATGDRPIVEQSRKDDFWGAKVADDGTLVGMNVLGRLLMELREQLKGDEAESLRFIEPLAICEFLLFGQPIEAVQAAPNAEIPGWTPRRPSQVDAVQPPPSDPQPSLFEQPMITETKPADSNPHVEAASGRKALARFPQYRESDLPWLGEIPAHWDVRRNGRLFAERVETGFEELPILEVSLRTGVRVRDMENGTRKQQMTDRSKYKRAAKGDIAYNMMRMWQGAVGVAPADGLISPAYVVARPFPEVEPRYYAYLFRTEAYKREVNKFSRGIVADRNRLYWDEFKQMPSTFPPTEEQTRIADFLDAHGRLTARLSRTKRKVLELAAERLGLLTAEVAQSINVKYVRLERVASLVSRSVDRQETEEYTPVGLYNRGRGIFHKEQTKGNELGDSSFFWIMPDDLVLSGQFAWEGAVALAGEDEAGCIASHRYPIVRGHDEVLDNAYLLAFFRSDFGHLLLDYHSRGAAGRNRPLNIRTLLKEKIPVPSMEQQAQVRRLIEVESAVRRRLKSELEVLMEYRARLIADVVTGKLDVRHIEIAAPADAPISDEDDELEEDLEGDDAEVMEGADADD
ncbi:MAG: NADAR domain-containing protein [Acetobacter sp.]|uniref:NADAR domain-containing protein n=1 Tax=Acetobacter sp. TaxID=440 RepID=UPI0039EB809D